MEYVDRTVEFILAYPLPYITGILIISYVLYKRKEHQTPDSEYMEMVESGDVIKKGIGLDKLIKRNADISGLVCYIIPLLESDRMVDRCGGQAILKKHYPDDYLLIEGYIGSEPRTECKEKIKDLYAKYNHQQPNCDRERQ